MSKTLDMSQKYLLEKINYGGYSLSGLRVIEDLRSNPKWTQVGENFYMMKQKSLTPEEPDGLLTEEDFDNLD